MAEQSTKNPIWISHRGYSAQKPENTAGSFDESLLHKFQFLETDLRLSRDGHLVLCHDPDLKRLMGIDQFVAKLTREELAALRFPGGEHLLFLDEFISSYPSVNWTFDIKPERAEETILRLIEAIEANELGERIADGRLRFLFWEEAHQQLFIRRYPKAQCYARVDECKRAGICVLLGLTFLGGIQKQKVYSLPENFLGMDCFQEKYVRRFQRRGAKVLAFLPSDDRRVKQACAAGCDEILTNGLRLEV